MDNQAPQPTIAFGEDQRAYLVIGEAVYGILMRLTDGVPAIDLAPVNQKSTEVTEDVFFGRGFVYDFGIDFEPSEKSNGIS